MYSIWFIPSSCRTAWPFKQKTRGNPSLAIHILYPRGKNNKLEKQFDNINKQNLHPKFLDQSHVIFFSFQLCLKPIRSVQFTSNYLTLSFILIVLIDKTHLGLSYWYHIIYEQVYTNLLSTMCKNPTLSRLRKGTYWIRMSFAS